jgi:signal transduction histidine kinase
MRQILLHDPAGTLAPQIAQILPANPVVSLGSSGALSLSASEIEAIVWVQASEYAESLGGLKRVREFSLAHSIGLLVICPYEHFSQMYAWGADELADRKSQPEEIAMRIQLAVNRAKHRETLRRAVRMQPIGELTSGIAHEINTPIQYIGDNVRFLSDTYQEMLPILDGCQQLLSSLPESDEQQAQFGALRQLLTNADLAFLHEELPSATQQTLEGIQRVSSIVRAMKEFVHPGTDSMVLTDLTHLVENALLVARNEWKYTAVVEKNVMPGMPLTPCLATEVSQVLLNLLVNAAHAVSEKFTSGNKGRIRVSIGADESFAILKIEDSGGGIPVEIRDRVFEPFFTTKAMGKGTGQGLAIAKAVVEQHHHGVLDLQDSDLGGAQFIIKLPLQCFEEHSFQKAEGKSPCLN